MTEIPIPILAKQAAGLSFNVNRDELERIAHLALAIAQEQIRDHPLAQPSDFRSLREYRERSPAERAALCAHAIRVMQALVLLGWISKPDA